MHRTSSDHTCLMRALECSEMRRPSMLGMLLCMRAHMKETSDRLIRERLRTKVEQGMHKSLQQGDCMLGFWGAQGSIQEG